MRARSVTARRIWTQVTHSGGGLFNGGLTSFRVQSLAPRVPEVNLSLHVVFQCVTQTQQESFILPELMACVAAQFPAVLWDRGEDKIRFSPRTVQYM